jgi:hypothetical protein
MMVISPETQEFKLTVITKNEGTYSNKDTVPRPFGEYERIVSFWNDGIIVVIPMAEVERVELIPVYEKR